MNGIKIKGVRIRNNNMFQGNVSTNQLKGRVPKMKIFEEFWVGIWYNNTKTPQRKYMNTVAKKIGQKVAIVQKFTINEKKLHQTIKIQKNSSAPRIDGVQNFW